MRPHPRDGRLVYFESTARPCANRPDQGFPDVFAPGRLPAAGPASISLPPPSTSRSAGLVRVTVTLHGTCCTPPLSIPTAWTATLARTYMPARHPAVLPVRVQTSTPQPDDGLARRPRASSSRYPPTGGRILGNPRGDAPSSTTTAVKHTARAWTTPRPRRRHGVASTSGNDSDPDGDPPPDVVHPVLARHRHRDASDLDARPAPNSRQRHVSVHGRRRHVGSYTAPCGHVTL